jgi:hypothetical protein
MQWKRRGGVTKLFVEWRTPRHNRKLRFVLLEERKAKLTWVALHIRAARAVKIRPELRPVG